MVFVESSNILSNIMKRFLKPENYLRCTFGLANRYFLGHVESILAPNPDEPLRHPPIFILGAPRSGSTLAVQVLTDALNIGYMSNRHCQWFGAPALAEKLFRPISNRPSSDYCSRHGVTQGLHAPAECGSWWYRFFRSKPSYMSIDDVDRGKMRAFRRSIASLINALDRPILFKNLYASLRIQAIAHYLPESLFIVIHRNELDNGHSLLEGRAHIFGDYQTWWSMEPPEIEILKKLPPHEQVIKQIRHTYRIIDSDLKLSKVESKRRMDFTYEDFCDNPASIIESVRLFMEQNGCQVRMRDIVLPESFSRQQEVRIEKKLYDSMCRYASGGMAFK